MKKLLILIVVLSLFLSGCASTYSSPNSVENQSPNTQEQTQIEAKESQQPETIPSSTHPESSSIEKNPIVPSSIATNPIPVLMFHYVRHVDKSTDLLGYNLSIEASTFEEILKYLQKEGYQSVHVADWLAGKVPAKPIILTFDDGYKDFYTTAFPLLKQYGFTASAAIISGRLDGDQYMTPENIREIHTAGIEILSHTVHHPDLAKTSEAKAKTEIEQSKTDLEKLTGNPVIGLVYPAGKYNDQTMDYVKNARYKAAFTTQPGFAGGNENLFELSRIRVDNRTSLESFIKKISRS